MERQFLTIEDLTKRYGISRTAVYNLVRRGEFPTPIKLGSLVRWHIREIEKYEEKLQHRNAGEVNS